MWRFLLGGVIGYALGSRAGRERYDHVVRTCRSIVDHPGVQGAAGVASAKISELSGRRSAKSRERQT